MVFCVVPAVVRVTVERTLVGVVLAQVAPPAKAGKEHHQSNHCDNHDHCNYPQGETLSTLAGGSAGVVNAAAYALGIIRTGYAL